MRAWGKVESFGDVISGISRRIENERKAWVKRVFRREGIHDTESYRAIFNCVESNENSK